LHFWSKSPLLAGFFASIANAVRQQAEDDVYWYRCMPKGLGDFLMVEYHKSSAAQTFQHAAYGYSHSCKNHCSKKLVIWSSEIAVNVRHWRDKGYGQSPICGTPP
jgi:hypothetical protein